MALFSPRILVSIASVALAAGVLSLALPSGAQTGESLPATTVTDGPCGSGGKTINVAPGENLQAALDTAAPGDSINLAEGTYETSARMDVPRVALRGAGEGTILQRSGDWNIRVGGDGVCIEDLQVAGGANEGILVAGTTGVSLLRVIVAEAGGAGIMARDAASVTMTNIDIRGAGVNGIISNNSRDIHIVDSTVRSGLRGIHFEGVQGGDILRTTVGPVGENGIVVERSTGPLLVNHNVIQGAGVGVWTLGSSGLTLEGNNIGPYGDLGFRIEGSRDVQILEGGVHDAQGGGDAIHIRASNNVRVVGVDANNIGNNALFATEVLDLSVDGLQAFNPVRGVHVLTGDRITLSNIHVQDASENGIVLENVRGPSLIDHGTMLNVSWGIWALRTDNLDIDGTVIEGSRDRGVRVEGSRDVAVTNISVRAGPRPTTTAGFDAFQSVGVSLRDSNISDTHVNAIFTDRTNDVTIANNFIHNAQRGIHMLRPDNAGVQGNTIDVVNENGIVVETGRRVTVETNELRGGQIGIWFRTGGDDSGNVIRDNDVSGFLSSGISLDLDTRDHAISENDIHNNARGIAIVAGGGSDLDQRVFDNLLLNNTITRNDFGIWSTDTRGTNRVSGGDLHSNRFCDIWVNGNTHVDVTGVGTQQGNITANDPNKVTWDEGPVSACAPDSDARQLART